MINDQHSAREGARAQLPCWYNEKAANIEHRECQTCKRENCLYV